MVIGNGMIASAFKQYINDEKIIIFASGVSNSKEQDNREYERECDLLKTFTSHSKKLVYFSTCSIFDGSLKNSKYIQHKIKIESFIEKNFENYLILRLPNVIGRSENPNTSFNYFKNKILKKEDIQIQENAVRYFIDIDDLVRILPIIISDEKENNKTINVRFDNKIKIINLILLCESILEEVTNKILIEGGERYWVNNSYFMSIIKKNNFKINKSYNVELLKKYLIA